MTKTTQQAQFDSTKKENVMTKVAVVGAGAWGKNLVRTFSSLGALATVCDASPQILKTVASQYPKVKTTSDFNDVLNDKSIESVVVSAPAALHYALAKEALLHGKHVFVEKPLSLKVKEGEELVALAKKQNRILMVGHILQYHNAVTKLKELIEQGELGQIQYIYSNRLNIGKIRSEENSLWSFAPHDISVILMFLNEFPETVYCSGGTYLQSNIADVTLTVMKFKSGVQAHFFVSWLHPFKEQKLIVVGTKKMAVFDDVSTEKLVLYPHRVDWIDRVPVASKAEGQTVSITPEEPLRNECQHFLDCIAAQKTPKTDGNEGLNVLRILEMAQESLNSGRTINAQESAVNKSNYSVHESAIVDAGVSIGDGTQIWHFSHVLKNSKIGKNCKIGQNVVIGPDATIGNGCKIQNNVSVYKGVTLEDDVFCGPSMVFTNVFNPRSAVPRMDELRTTLVKKGTTIGANATILCGITIGRYSFIGAGAVVTKDVPDYALVYGNPGKVQGFMCECGEKLYLTKNKASCKSCSRKYLIKNKKVLPA